MQAVIEITVTKKLQKRSHTRNPGREIDFYFNKLQIRSQIDHLDFTIT